MANYAFEKGKYGGSCGTIYPFFQKLTSPFPNDEIKNYVPAGYLRCRGQILRADDYPNLARIIGVGETCLYKKENTQLIDPLPDGTGGTFQLPDLGSKYITAGTNSGEYLYMTAIDPTTNQDVLRAGIETSFQVSSDQIDFFYRGDFSVPVKEIQINGSWRVTAPTRTDSNILFINNFLGHGHGSSCATVRTLNNPNLWLADRIRRTSLGDFLGTNCPSEVPSAAPTIATHSVWNTPTIAEIGSDDGTEHSHFNVNARITREEITTKEMGGAGNVISASGLTTTVNINSSQAISLSEITPKFILCEFLIKY
jgi:hypothetical protein